MEISAEKSYQYFIGGAWHETFIMIISQLWRKNRHFIQVHDNYLNFICSASVMVEILLNLNIFNLWYKNYTLHTSSRMHCMTPFSSVQFSSVAQSCLTLWDPMDCSMPGFPVHHQLPELGQTHVYMNSDNGVII